MLSKKTLCLALCGLLSCGVITTPSLANNGAKTQQVNAIAAIVNKNVITAYQVQQAINNVKKHMRESHITPPSDSIIRENIIKQLVNEELQLQMADRAGIKITDAELTAAIANIAKSNRLTVKQLTAKINQQGESFSQFRTEIRKQMLISKVQHEAVASKVNITDAQVDKALANSLSLQQLQKSYHIADIVVGIPDNADKTQLANAKNRAKDIYKKLKSGGNFSKLAKLESNNVSGPNNGDLGWKPGSEVPDLFMSKITHMKTGDISKPIQAGNGFHILKLLGVKQGGRHVTRQQIKLQLQEKSFHKAVEKWVNGLRKSAYIKVNS